MSKVKQGLTPWLLNQALSLGCPDSTSTCILRLQRIFMTLIQTEFLKKPLWSRQRKKYNLHFTGEFPEAQGNGKIYIGPSEPVSRLSVGCRCSMSFPTAIISVKCCKTGLLYSRFIWVQKNLLHVAQKPASLIDETDDGAHSQDPQRQFYSIRAFLIFVMCSPQWQCSYRPQYRGPCP